MASKWQRGPCGTMPGDPLEVAGIVSSHVPGKPFIGKYLSRDLATKSLKRDSWGSYWLPDAAGPCPLPEPDAGEATHCRS